MKKNKINNVIEYFSLTLIFSYFFIHNIILVLIGIVLSLYLININRIDSFMRFINKNSISKELAKNEKVIKSDLNNIKPNKEDTKLSLVEEIEEFGFIPSIDNKNDSNAAWLILYIVINSFLLKAYYLFTN